MAATVIRPLGSMSLFAHVLHATDYIAALVFDVITSVRTAVCTNICKCDICRARHCDALHWTECNPYVHH